LGAIGITIDTDRVHRVIGWWFFAVTLSWALIVRRYIL
jgi:hypothetical protein